MNIDRGLFRFFVIGLVAVSVVIATVAYMAVKQEQERIDGFRNIFLQDIANPACVEIITERGTLQELRARGCLDSFYYYSNKFWSRALEVNSRTGQEIGLAMFDKITADLLSEQIWSLETAKLLLLAFGAYTLACLCLYLVYRVLRWGIAGFKSD